MTKPLLQVSGLTKHYPIKGGLLGRQIASVQAVTDVSFELDAGETLAVVGESGCGKSTMGRALLRLHEPTAGQVTLGGQDITGASPAELRDARRRMQMIFQDPFGSLNPRMTVRETVMEPILLHGIASGEAAERLVLDLLATVGLSPFHAGRYPHEFSGGQRQRICIARALSTNPALIVCDEPVSALDVSVQAQVVNLLQDLQKAHGMAYVFISHDLAVVRHIADRVAVMYLGRVVEIADTASLYAHPRHPYTRTLMQAAPRPDPTVRPVREAVRGDMPSALKMPSGCAFHSRCPMAQPICSSQRPDLRKVQGGRHEVACHFAEDALPATEAVVEKPVPPSLARRLAIMEQAAAGA